MQDHTTASFIFPSTSTTGQYRRQSAYRMAGMACLTLLLIFLSYFGILDIIVEVEVWVSDRPLEVFGLLVCFGVFLAAQAVRNLYALADLANDSTLDAVERLKKAVSLYKANVLGVRYLLRGFAVAFAFTAISFIGKLMSGAGPQSASLVPTLLLICGWAVPLFFLHTPVFNFWVSPELRSTIYSEFPPSVAEEAFETVNASRFGEEVYDLSNLPVVLLYQIALRDGTLDLLSKFAKK